MSKIKQASRFELHPKSWTPQTERVQFFMTKYSKEEKLAAIKAVEAGESIAEVARQYQINDSVLEWEVRSYHEHGEKGLGSHAYNWPAEQKCEVLKYMHESQLSFAETGILLGISDST
jgi:transposase-like protein